MYRAAWRSAFGTRWESQIKNLRPLQPQLADTRQVRPISRWSLFAPEFTTWYHLVPSGKSGLSGEAPRSHCVCGAKPFKDLPTSGRPRTRLLCPIVGTLVGMLFHNAEQSCAVFERTAGPLTDRTVVSSAPSSRWPPATRPWFRSSSQHRPTLYWREVGQMKLGGTSGIVKGH